jgi:hypothetical protein
MRLTINVLAYLLLSLPLATDARSDANHLFSLKLHAPVAPIKSGTEVRLKVTVTNVSDHSVRFGRTPGIVPEEELSYLIEVRDAPGQLPPLTPFFQSLRENPSSTWGSYITYELEPGKSFDDELVITKLYVLTQPGKYTVWVARGQDPLDKSGKSVVKSNEVTVAITK